MNVSSPHDLLVSVQYWWEEKVLAPSPAKPHLFFFLPQEKLCVWQWPCECCGFSALQMSSSALLSQSPAEQQHHLHRVQAGITPYECVPCAACVMGIVWWTGISWLLVLGTHWKTSDSCQSLQVLTMCIVPLTPGTALPPGWICKPLFETTLAAVHHGQLLFSLHSVCEVGLQETHTDTVLCFF